MKAYFSATGLTVKVNKKDLFKDSLECIIETHNKPKVKLNISRNVFNRDFEEPGFHLEYFPREDYIKNSKKINVFLTYDRWNKLISEKDNEAMCGYFTSRVTSGLRFDISYND